MRRAAAEGSVAVVARETRRGGVVVSDGRPHLPLLAQPSAAAVWVGLGLQRQTSKVRGEFGAFGLCVCFVLVLEESRDCSRKVPC